MAIFCKFMYLIHPIQLGDTHFCEVVPNSRFNSLDVNKYLPLGQCFVKLLCGNVEKESRNV